MLVLASASPRRRELLERLRVPFEVDPADVDESPLPGLAPEHLAALLAERKAATVAARRGDGAPVLGADTVVVAADGRLLGKPTDADDARAMLRALSGTTQRVITGLCLCVGERRIVDAVETRVTMRGIGDDEIAAYVASGESFGKAGAYAIQETGDRFVTAVEGSWTNVVGLPVERVSEMLAALGIPVAETR